jgi:hypothetical protein
MSGVVTAATAGPAATYSGAQPEAGTARLTVAC